MRKLTMVFGIATVAAVLAAGWCWQQWQAERARAAELQRQIASLQTRPAPPASAPVLSEAPAAAAASATPDNAPPPGTTVAYLSDGEAKELATNRAIRAQMRKQAQREREMLRDPEYRQSQRAELRRRYAPLRADAIRVGMTPQQADRILDLELDGITRYTELGGIAGQPPGEAAQTEMRRAADAAQAELREMLGEELYAKWTRFRASVQEHGEVSQWAVQLSEPLNDKQADSLADSLYVERQRSHSEYEDYVKAAGITDRYTVSPADRQRWLDLEKEANRRTHDAMATSLSTAQLSSLDAMLAERLVPIEAALRLQLQGKAGNSN
jgi:hypothetical protein